MVAFVMLFRMTILNNTSLIDGNIMDRQGPRIADAVEEVARILYPEVF